MNSLYMHALTYIYYLNLSTERTRETDISIAKSKTQIFGLSVFSSKRKRKPLKKG